MISVIRRLDRMHTPFYRGSKRMIDRACMMP